MADRKVAVGWQLPSSPKEPHIGSPLSPAQAQQYATVQRNALADVRLGSPSAAPVTNKKQRHEQRQLQDPPHAAAPLEHREMADTGRNIAVQVDPLSPTLQRMGAPAGGLRPAVAAAQGVAISTPLAVAAPAAGGEDIEDRLPSLELVAGGIRVLGGHAEDGTDSVDSTVACVFIYMIVVVATIAAVLVYFFRSLYAEPSEMTPIDYDEEEELPRTRRPLERLTTTAEYEQEGFATGPLRFARRGKITSAIPHGPDAHSVDGGGTGLVTIGTADVEGGGGLEDGAMASQPVVTSPDEEQRFVRYLASLPASGEGDSNRTHNDNWDWTRSVKAFERKSRFKQYRVRRIG
ncbi:uncharacterized protein [Dermacentor albipictus]|uniref:uncharacterized protein n=1 Tax=Dermacentor albipictus TaxID=60249 RepID=UPI0038FD013F